MWSQVSRWISYPLGWLFLMLVPLAIIGASNTSGASSRVNQFTIERFDAAYDARPGNDGRLELEVTERIVVNFPHLNTNRGIERRLDAKYGDTNLRISASSPPTSPARTSPTRGAPPTTATSSSASATRMST